MEDRDDDYEYCVLVEAKFDRKSEAWFAAKHGVGGSPYRAWLDADYLILHRFIHMF
jgi:hypothetical protein